MDSRTYGALYGPARIAPPPRRTGVVLLSAGLWLLTSLSASWLAFLVGMTTLWAAAEGASIGGFPLCCSAVLCGGAGALVAVCRAPAVRRMPGETRSLLLGALACPFPLVLAIAAFSAM
ncbi:hypothetical protein ACF058_13665 [Streptomyces sp. NPDC015501]|uniref:hypothetical protein n=1 Tax=unclassified Streptomyces TaxID=2593676 RepID=UPI00119D9F57|nr:hypothetical protein A3L22_14755 [Streptomyces griseus subsp. griseus]WSS58624.1 hypothetical protein OG543_26210 [Streptomyces sp. NBC_01178]